MRERPSERAAEPLREEDFRRLAALRDGWLAEGRRESRWRDARDLELFDRTFGRRIAWKWRAALDEARDAGFAAPGGVWLDLGCGTAVATRAVLAAFPVARPDRVVLVDAAPLAREEARTRLAAEHPDLAVEPAADPPPGVSPDLLLVSHVLLELDDGARERLLALARRSAFVLVVEAGDRPTARSLSELRDALLPTHAPLAPCPHGGPCGVLAPGAEREWCHRFAAPDPEVFTTGEWARLSRRLGFDRRSLPFASLALARRSSAVGPPRAPAPPPGDGTVRLRPLGRPKVEKGRLLLSVCTAAGVRRVRLLEREDRRLCRALAEGASFELEGVLDGERLRAPRRCAPRSAPSGLEDPAADDAPDGEAGGEP